jgi:hypothetical protein
VRLFGLWLQGSERFRPLTSMYYRNAHAVVLCVDCKDCESALAIEYLTKWLGDIDRCCPEQCLVLLAITKVDLRWPAEADKLSPGARDAQLNRPTGPGAHASVFESHPSMAKVLEWARAHGIPYVFTSSKTGLNVQHAFELLAHLILDRVESFLITGDFPKPKPIPKPSTTSSCILQ